MSFHFSNRDCSWICTCTIHVYDFSLLHLLPFELGVRPQPSSSRTAVLLPSLPAWPCVCDQWPVDILEHPVSQVRQYDALWKSLCQGRKVEGRREGYSSFTKSTNCSQTQKRLSTAWLQKEFNIPFSRVNDADQRIRFWKDKLSCPLHFQTWRKKHER